MSYPSKDQLERTKISIEIVTYATAISLILLAVFNAGYLIEKVARTFKESGVKLDEVNLFNTVKFKISDALAAADSTAEELKTALGLVVCQANNACSTEQKAQVDRIKANAPALNASVTRVQQDLKDALAQSERVVERVEQQNASAVQTRAQAAGGWIALVGADRTLDSAEFEVNRIKPAFPQTVILFAEGWYRTVVRFNNEAEARAAVPRLSTLTNRQPYVRSFNEWCPGAVSDDRGVIKCGARAS